MGRCHLGQGRAGDMQSSDPDGLPVMLTLHLYLR